MEPDGYSFELHLWISEKNEAILILRSDLPEVSMCGKVKGRVTQALDVALIHMFLMKLE